jgi:hypothetical protein
VPKFAQTQSAPFDPGGISGIGSSSLSAIQIAAKFSPRQKPPSVPGQGPTSTVFQPSNNLVYSTVASSGAPSPAQTGQTITLVDASTFPSPGVPGVVPYSIVVWPASSQPTRANEEILTLTAVDYGTNVITVSRAAEGSTPRTIVDGDQVAMAITQRTATDLEGAWYGLDARIAKLEALTTLIGTSQLTRFSGAKLTRINDSSALATGAVMTYDNYGQAGGNAFDTDGYYSPTLSTSILGRNAVGAAFTIPPGLGGYFLIGANTDVAGAFSGWINLTIESSDRTDGIAQSSDMRGATTSNPLTSVVAFYKAAAGVQIHCALLSSGNVILSGNEDTSFWIVRLG